MILFNDRKCSRVPMNTGSHLCLFFFSLECHQRPMCGQSGDAYQDAVSPRRIGNFAAEDTRQYFQTAGRQLITDSKRGKSQGQMPTFRIFAMQTSAARVLAVWRPGKRALRRFFIIDSFRRYKSYIICGTFPSLSPNRERG